MHLEVKKGVFHCLKWPVSILVSKWMHLEVKNKARIQFFVYVSILVSKWMHLEDNPVQTFESFLARFNPSF